MPVEDSLIHVRVRFAAVLAIVAAAVVAIGAQAQTATPQKTTVDIPYTKFVLDNGLTLIVHEDHKAPIVAVNMWYHVGSANEKPGKTGFAHLFEHLMFGGSEHAKGSYIEALEKVGATDLNGTTNGDRTNYFEDVPNSALDYALFMESDRMGSMINAIDQKTLDLQRGVVQNEKRQGENQPYGVTRQLLTKNTYPAGHPYSWTTIGDMADLDAASMADVKDWFKTYYGPSNVVIVIAGDVDTKVAKAKVEKYFGDIPAGPPVAHQQIWIAKRTGTHREVVQDRVPQARIYKVWNIPEYGSADGDYLDMVSDILAKGKTSRLYKRLVYDDQIATNVVAFADTNKIAGQFEIQVTAKPTTDPDKTQAELDRVEKEIDEELARFLKNGPTAEELERVKIQNQAAFVRGLERIGGFGGKSDILAVNEVFLGDAGAYKITQKRIQDATAADLRDAANRWLTDGVYILSVLPFPEYKTAATGADRSKLPTPGTAPELKLPTLQHSTLSNGLKIVLAERHDVPVVDLSLIIDAGFAADQSAAPGTASMTTALLTGGTKTLDALQISDHLELLGAELTAASNLDSTIVNFSALKSKLDPSLDLFADIVLNPSFPEADFLRTQKLQLATIKREENTPTTMPLRVLPALLYGAGHAYGGSLTGSGTTESVGKLTRADLVKFHAVWFRPNNSTLVIVGDTKLTEIKPILEKLFANWKAGDVPKKNIGVVALPSKTAIYIIDKPGAQQSVIYGGTIAPPTANPQEVAIIAMNDELGGTFGSRLNMNLREDKHWSYGVGTRITKARAQRPFRIIAPVQTDKTKEALVELNKELRGILADNQVGKDELANTQDNETLKLPGSRETLDDLVTSIDDQVQYNLPDDYYQTYGGKVRALTTTDIAGAAKTVVHPDNIVWIVVGDRTKIEPGIRELNLGEVKILSPDGKIVQ
jgi:zinc protease